MDIPIRPSDLLGVGDLEAMVLKFLKPDPGFRGERNFNPASCGASDRRKCMCGQKTNHTGSRCMILCGPRREVDAHHQRWALVGPSFRQLPNEEPDHVREFVGTRGVGNGAS